MKKLMMVAVSALCAAVAFGETEAVDLTKIIREEGQVFDFTGSTGNNGSQYDYAKAFDDNPDTQCLLTIAPTVANPAVLAFKLTDSAWHAGERMRVTALELVCKGNNAQESRSPRDFTVFAKADDAGEWSEVGRWVNVYDWTYGEAMRFEFATPIVSRTFKISVSSCLGKAPSFTTFAEVRLFGTLSSDPTVHVHTYGDWEVEMPATALTDGKAVRVCSYCDAEERKVLPAGWGLDDSLVIDRVAWACENGVATYDASTFIKDPGKNFCYTPRLAFDSDATTRWMGDKAAGNWVGIVYADNVNGGKGVRVRRYEVTFGDATRLPSDFEFQGSNDGEVWTTLDRQNPGPTMVGTYAYDIANPGFYLRYRFYSNSGVSGAYTRVDDIKLLGDLRDASISVGETIPNQEYKNGAPLTPAIDVRDASTGEPLTKNVDYAVTYLDNTSYGTATVIVEGLGVRRGEAYTRHFKVVPVGYVDGSLLVSPTGSDESGDGSLEHPFASLEKAVASGNAIFLMPGTYVFPQTALRVAKSLSVKGSGRDVTILTGDSDNDQIPDRGGFIFSGTSTTSSLANLTITACTTAGRTSHDAYGCAINLNGTAAGATETCLYLTNVAITACANATYGNAIYAYVGHLIMEDCLLSGNGTSVTQGGTICIRPGGGTSLLVDIKRTEFLENFTFAVRQYDSSKNVQTLTDCKIVRNKGGVQAGAGFHVINTLFKDIEICQDGGTAKGAIFVSLNCGVTDILLRGCFFTGNKGTALYVANEDVIEPEPSIDLGNCVSVENCTFDANETFNINTSARGRNVCFRNCLFAGSTAQQVPANVLANVGHVTYCAAAYANTTGFVAGNEYHNVILAGRVFMDGQAPQLRNKRSKAVDAGYPAAWAIAPGAKDILGNPRLVGDGVDIGCSEYKPLGLVLILR